MGVVGCQGFSGEKWSNAASDCGNTAVAADVCVYQSQPENTSRFSGVCLLNGQVTTCALDTGSAMSFISSTEPVGSALGHVSVRGVNGLVRSYPLVDAVITLDGRAFEVTAGVVPHDLGTGLLIGRDILEGHRVSSIASVYWMEESSARPGVCGDPMSPRPPLDSGVAVPNYRGGARTTPKRKPTKRKGKTGKLSGGFRPSKKAPVTRAGSGHSRGANRATNFAACASSFTGAPVGKEDAHRISTGSSLVQADPSQRVRRNGVAVDSFLTNVLPYASKFPSLPAAAELRAEQESCPRLRKTLDELDGQVGMDSGPLAEGKSRFTRNTDGLLVRHFRNHGETFAREQLVLSQPTA